ncbi:MAG: dihydrofolate reductase family protein [Hyphomicrobiales bacterium]
MRKLAVLAFVTLDGVMQAPSSPEEDRSGNFDLGGWAASYWDGVMPHVEQTAMSEPYDILFGRKTYDLFASHWPNNETSRASERLNAARKYVVTSTPLTIDWQNSHELMKDLRDDVSQLKSEDGPLLQIHGSANLIQSLLQHNLIDEFRLWTFPVTIGAGKRLFENTHQPLNLTLSSSENLANGIVAQVYRKAI